MKYIDYKERRTQGTFDFPIAFYHQTPSSPRYHMTCHWHPQYEIIYIAEGSFSLTLNNEENTYPAGSVILISGGMLHGGIPRDCRYDCIVFDLNMLLQNNHACAKTIQDILTRKIQFHTNLSRESGSVLPIVKALCDTLAGKAAGYEFTTLGLLYQLLGTILSEHLYSENAANTLHEERLDSVKQALDYIADHYRQDIRLQDLARIAGMNSNYFCRVFQSVTDRTPIDYLNFYRIECACELLSTKDISIREAAISCGFNDESYFIRTFRKYKGITPRRFSRKEF